MSCNKCNNNYFIPSYTGYYPCDCQKNTPSNMTCTTTCTENIGCIPTDAECVIYTGETLATIGVNPNDTLEEILIHLNDIFSPGGDPDYSGYDTACLSEYGTVGTQSQFVETISEVLCNLLGDFEDFVDNIYTPFSSATTSLLGSINVPDITDCESFPIEEGATIVEILQDVVDNLCDINESIDLSGIAWDNCLTPLSTPSTVREGIIEILRQICVVNTNIGPQVDTYKVKLNALDTTENFLQSKLKSTGCISISQVTDGGIEKLQLGLSFTPSSYNFNPSHFDVTSGTLGDCVQQYNVSLNSSVISEAITCETVQELFEAAVENPSVIYGSNDIEGCTTYVPCQLREFLFNEYSNGDYLVTVDSSEGTCEKVYLKPLPAFITYDPNSVSWDTCELPCGITAPSTLEESFTEILSQICCVYNLIPQHSVSNTFYVSDKQVGVGDGSAINPFATIVEAYNAVIGSGSADSPQYVNAQIYVYKGTYTTDFNAYIRGITYHFEKGTVVNHVGTTYFIEADVSNTFDTPIYITGGLTYNSFTSGLLKIVRSTVSSNFWNSAIIDLQSANYNVGALSSPHERAFIHLECLNPTSTWGRVHCSLNLGEFIQSTNQTIINCIDGPQLLVKSSGMGNLRLIPNSASDANHFRWVYNNADRAYAYASTFKFDSIYFTGQNLNYSIHVEGLCGASIISYCLTQATAQNSQTGRFMHFVNVLPTKGYNNGTSQYEDDMLLIDNLIIFKNSNFQHSDIITGARVDPTYNNVNFKDCVIPEGYFIDKTNLNYNIDIGVGHNIENGMFNLSNVPEYANNSAAILDGLTEGDVYKTSTGTLMVTY